YALKYWGWDVQMVEEQIVARDTGTPITGFDLKSIMMYQFPAGLARYIDQNGISQSFETDDNTELSALDKVAAATAYPSEDGPARNKPSENLRVSGAATRGSLAKAKEVALFQFTTDAKGDYRLDLAGPMPALLGALKKPREIGKRHLTAYIIGAAET